MQKSKCTGGDGLSKALLLTALNLCLLAAGPREILSDSSWKGSILALVRDERKGRSHGGWDTLWCQTSPGSQPYHCVILGVVISPSRACFPHLGKGLVGGLPRALPPHSSSLKAPTARKQLVDTLLLGVTGSCW